MDVPQAAVHHITIRELHLHLCEVTVGDAVKLAAVASRLRVLHLER